MSPFITIEMEMGFSGDVGVVAGVCDDCEPVVGTELWIVVGPPESLLVCGVLCGPPLPGPSLPPPSPLQAAAARTVTAATATRAVRRRCLICSPRSSVVAQSDGRGHRRRDAVRPSMSSPLRRVRVGSPWEVSRVLRTRSKVRVLTRDDLPAVRRVIDQDPITNVFVDHRVRATRLDPRWLGGQLWGYDDGTGIVSLCHAAANLIPVAAGPEALQAFAVQALAQGRQCSAILGPHDQVQVLWTLLADEWGPARDQRLRQPFLTLDRVPDVEPDPLVRRVRADELDALYPACVAMFTEELGISPEAGAGARLYRSRVSQLVSKGLAFARFENGRVVFKAEVAAVTPYAGQIQGVWVDPTFRGRGVSAPALAAVSAAVLADLAPVVSLYVNEHNLAARRAYARVGFVERTRFATILF
jgi:predicted GNAT family acetyltransferase